MNALSDSQPEDGTGIAQPAKTTRMFLKLLRAMQPISRIDMARRLGINRSTVTDIVKPLIASDLIREEPLHSEDDDRPQGRPPIGLSFNDKRDFFVGLNLGVRRSQIGLTTLSGEILAEEDYETPATAEEALKIAKERIQELCSTVSDRKLQTIGVTVAGPTDAARRTLLYAPNLGWRDVTVADYLQLDESVPVIVENDATAAAMYEARLKISEMNDGQLNNFILVRSGTGIGVGLVIGGEVYSGAGWWRGVAGEFGHMTIVAGGKSCVCGNKGCWERYASAASAASLYTGDRAQPAIRTLRFNDIVERAKGGEIRARKTLEKIGDSLGIGIANVIMGVGISRIVVSGRLVYGWDFIKDPLHEAVRKSIIGKLSNWTVECGEPKGAAIGGAFEVAVENYLLSSALSQ